MHPVSSYLFAWKKLARNGEIYDKNWHGRTSDMKKPSPVGLTDTAEKLSRYLTHHHIDDAH